uniref:Core-binding (CB) domain-containing protein n=1 Tax=Trichogramma kaykai TaxID=54128 RepID=A0ABD2W283_9HYME
MVGKLVAACIAVQYGWLYIKIFEGKKIQALKRSNGSYKGNRTMCEEIKSDMRRWNDNLGSAKKEFKFKEISKDPASSQIRDNVHDGSSGITRAFIDTDFQQDSLDIVLISLSKSTMKHYKSSLQKWISYCDINNIDPYNPAAVSVISFLTKRFKESLSYSSINSDKSAIPLISTNEMGNDKLVKRFMKGSFKSRPPVPKYNHTWDVETVFTYFEQLKDDKDLSIE